MEGPDSTTWNTFFHSLFSIGGTVIGFLIFFFLLSLLSNFLGKFSRLKPKFYLSILPDAEGMRKKLSRFSPLLLQINIEGVIGREEMNLELIETQLIESRFGILKNRIKGIFLKIDSPGGGATDSDAIYRRLKNYKEKYKVPIYAYVDGFCASGGLLIACSADKILATPSSIIGSVGVRLILPYLNFSKVLEKWDIGVKTLSIGKHKDHLNPFRPWEEGEDADLKQLLIHAYNRFVDIVSNERKIEREKLVQDIGAQIYAAPESASLKFIDDGSSDYSLALASLAEAANLKTESYQVVELVKRKSWFKEMMEKSLIFTGSIKHEISIGHYLPSHLFGKIGYLFLPHGF